MSKARAKRFFTDLDFCGVSRQRIVRHPESRGRAAKVEATDLELTVLRGSGEGDIEIINALIRTGADVNGRNDEGRTALVYAEEANHAAAAAIIVESGGRR